MHTNGGELCLGSNLCGLLMSLSCPNGGSVAIGTPKWHMPDILLSNSDEPASALEDRFSAVC